MSKKEYPYPQDEFDIPNNHGGPVGTHRKPQTTWQKIWPFLVTILVCSVAAVGLVFFLSEGPFVKDSTLNPVAQNTTSTPADVDQSQDPSAEPTATETLASQTPSPESTDPTAEPTPTESATPSPTIELNQDVKFRVRNGTGVAGTAGRTVDFLDSLGWPGGIADNYTQSTIKESTVRYKTRTYEAEASAIAAALGISQVTLTPSLADSIDVVLVSDFEENF